MVVQDDGKIVMTASGGFDTEDFVVARFNSDGSPDTSFGSAGTVATDFAGHNDFVWDIATYGNDQILVIGSPQLSASDSYFGLARYLGDDTPASADLSVTMGSALGQDHFGNRFITYTMKLADNGPDKAYYATLKDRLPLETTFQSLTVPAGWVVYSKPAVGQWGTVSFSRTRFGPQSANVTLVVKVLPNISHVGVTNRATFTSSFTADPDLANNTASTQTTVP